MPRGIPNPPTDRGVAIVCLGIVGANATPLSSATWWASLEEALEADRELLTVPCGRRCCGQHLIVYHDGDRERVRPSVHTPPTYALADEMARCYGQHDPDRHLPPPDPDYNQPLIYAADVLAEWKDDDAAAETVGLPTVSDLDDADQWLLEHAL